MKNINSILFLFISLVLNAQVKFENKTNQQPVSNVTLLSSDGKIMGRSNMDGNLNIVDIDREFKIADSDTVEAAHPDFIPKKLIWSDLKSSQVCFLTPIKELKEVIVTGKQQEFLMLKGYFYTYASVDDTPWAFSDGIIEYYISLKNNKVAGLNIVENRTFTTNLKDSINRKGKKKLISVSLTPSIYPLSLKGEWLLISKKRNTAYSQSNDFLMSKTDTLGKVIHDGSNITLSIEYSTPARPENFSLFGIHLNTVNRITSESFSEKLSLPYLKTISNYEKTYYNRKEITEKYIEIADFYVLDKKFLSKEEIKKVKFNTSNRVSNYSFPFWENQELPPLPSFISDKLYNELILEKKQ